MRFLIQRASRKAIGEEIPLLDKTIVDDDWEYGILEITELNQLPKERFILSYHIDIFDEEALDNMGLSESYVDAVLTLYDDYIE